VLGMHLTKALGYTADKRYV